ncbi:hypothetical protein D9611_011796 [Ephemerocybe angulata]|uniref:Aldehyde dehydrogenase domain-containing protein n=1 Tax=Ephemerocybe angulata TaxID=980116 RepID=A0A8H5BXZ9_9AGAR|nr:hypothetical protein D9611_011796 [Tulosesus angulatus]
MEHGKPESTNEPGVWAPTRTLQETFQAQSRAPLGKRYRLCSIFQPTCEADALNPDPVTLSAVNLAPSAPNCSDGNELSSSSSVCSEPLLASSITKIQILRAQEAWKARVEKKAKGVVLIISPWSYPIILTFQALCGAIAAGCCAHKTLRSLTDILQASRRTHTERNTSILLRIASHWAVFRRSRRSSSSNGPTRSAAAAKHLTPMTLELGGNIPVIIDGRDLGV